MFDQYLRRAFPAVLICGLFFNLSSAYAQYRLPSLSLLKKEGLKEIRVFKQALRFEYLDSNNHEDQGDLDASRDEIIRYFLGDHGKLDSIYHYPKENTYYLKDELIYDKLGRLVELRTKTATGELKSLYKVDISDGGEGYFIIQNQGVLNYEKWFNSDSVITKYIMHRMPIGKTYMLYEYNLEQEMRSESWFIDGELRTKRTYQWFALDGIPYRFIHTAYSSDGEQDPDAGEYLVDSLGRVVNDQMEFFTDPFMSHNYFKRHEMFPGIQHQHQQFFVLDSLASYEDRSQLWSFDGTTIVYRYSFQYQ